MQQTTRLVEQAAFDEYFSEFDARLTDSFELWRRGDCDPVGFVWRWVLHGYLRRDSDFLASMVTEDFAHRDPLNFGHVVRGPREFRRVLQDTFVAFPDARFAAAGAPYLGLETGALMIPWRAMGTFSGPLNWGAPGSRRHIAPTGRRFDFTGVDEYMLRDGKVCQRRSLYDAIDVMRQLALLPDPDCLAMRLAPWAQAAAAAVIRAVSR